MKIQSFIFLILFFLFSQSIALGQVSEQQKIDLTLTNAFIKMVKADYELRFDSLAPAFTILLKKTLTNPATFNYRFDSLSQYIAIEASADKKIIFYGWDDHTGGSWHSLNCLAQFKSDDGKQIIIEQLHAGNEADPGESADRKVYKVHDLTVNGKRLYLTFAWGTHGGGHQFNIVELYALEDNKLVQCDSCFAGNYNLVLEYPRGEKLNLIFDPKTNRFFYNEFRKDKATGFYHKTGKVISYKLINGVFTKK